MQRGKESPTNFSLSSGQGHRHSRRFDSRWRPMQRGKESPTNFSLSSGQGHRQTEVCRLGKGIDIHAGSTRGGGRCNAVKKVRQTSVCRLGKGIDKLKFVVWARASTFTPVRLAVEADATR